MTEIHELGVAESAKKIREGSLSSVELTEVLLTRIEAHSEGLPGSGCGPRGSRNL